MSIADFPDSALNSSTVKQHTFKRRVSIPSDNNTLWQINKGVVRISTIDEDGVLITLGLWGSGDIVGKSLSRVIPYQIECLTDVEAIALPPFTPYPTSALLSHVQQTEEFLQIIQHRMIEKRLMRFLIWLFSRFGQDTQDGKQLDLHLTHQEIADAIGTTRVTVTRCMKNFQQERILQGSKRTCLLLRI